MRAYGGLNLLLLGRWGAGAPGAGEGPVAPNVAEFRRRRSAVRNGLVLLRVAIFFALAGSALTLLIGAMVMGGLPGGFSGPSTSGAISLLGTLSLGAQLIAMWIGLEFVDLGDNPGPLALDPKEATGGAAEALGVGALLVALLGGVFGFFGFLRASLLRLHPGPAPTPYGPDFDIVAQAAVLGATSVAFNLAVALWLRSTLNPYLKPEERRAWIPFFAAVVAGSLVAVALTFYGIYFMGGDNPAGLAGGISMVSLLLLFPIASQAAANVRDRPEPAPERPPIVPVPAPIWPPGAVAVPPPPPAWPTPPGPVATVPASAAPRPVGPQVAAPPPQAPWPVPPSAPYPPPPGYTTATAALQAAPDPYPLPPPPARCPRCGSPRLAYALPPARGFLCHHCGLAGAY